MDVAWVDPRHCLDIIHTGCSAWSCCRYKGWLSQWSHKSHKHIWVSDQALCWTPDHQISMFQCAWSGVDYFVIFRPLELKHLSSHWHRTLEQFTVAWSMPHSTVSTVWRSYVLTYFGVQSLFVSARLRHVRLHAVFPLNTDLAQVNACKCSMCLFRPIFSIP